MPYSSERISVVVADDHPVTREGIVRLLRCPVKNFRSRAAFSPLMKMVTPGPFSGDIC
jgi:hypothetical protein